MGATVYAFNEFVQLDTTRCAVCGVIFALPAHMRVARQQDGQSFYCPNGHSLSYKESEVDRLKKQLEREQHARMRAEAFRAAALKDANHNAIEWRKAKTRLKNTRERIKHGVCPCCKRSFVQLARHMATKHPDFGRSPEA